MAATTNTASSGHISDREFWLIVRAALLAIVKAIERKYICKEDPIDIVH